MVDSDGVIYTHYLQDQVTLGLGLPTALQGRVRGVLMREWWWDWREEMVASWGSLGVSTTTPLQPPSPATNGACAAHACRCSILQPAACTPAASPELTKPVAAL